LRVRDAGPDANSFDDEAARTAVGQSVSSWIMPVPPLAMFGIIRNLNGSIAIGILDTFVSRLGSSFRHNHMERCEAERQPIDGASSFQSYLIVNRASNARTGRLEAGGRANDMQAWLPAQ
jgi:hypothetical protein